ncbi:MAG TPA: nitrilase-related carbon-nitrogen hydrolase [Candidatus Kapabacteria bacterium]|nr:nitrilase-related carbon-nitrogen hydrolase [Candidatus Kapabacteria bacterium]
MKLAVVQFCPEFSNIEKNSSKMLDFAKNTDCNIIIFPELAFTGYDFISKDEVAKYAFDINSEILQSFKEISKDTNKIIVVGFPEKSNNNYYNSAAILFPDSKFNDTYRKTHLFYRERFIFSENDKGFFVINYPDFDLNLGTMICYDWRFPEATRALALKGADVIACPSNLVTKVWDISMPSRALENKVYLAVSNRTGSENRNGDDVIFNGSSKIYSYNGTVLCETGINNEAVIVADIEPEKTRNKSFNEFNDIFSDRRPQFYL